MAYFFSILLLTAPLYVWRFSIGGLPTNFLMTTNFVVIGLGILLVCNNKDFARFKSVFLSLGKFFLISITLFSLAGIISLFAFDFNLEKVGQWLVLYAQPLVIFVLVRYFADKDVKVAEYFKISAYVLVGTAGTLALMQYFTLLTLPEQWWGNANEPKRAIAFFAHANAYGLFMTPLLAWLIPDVFSNLKDIRNDVKKYWYVLAWIVGAFGVFLSLSRGAWLGLFLAVGVFVILSANKKMILSFAVMAVILAGVVAAVPNLRYRVLLPFHGEKSSVARLSLWNTGLDMVKDSPVLGKGINGFSDNWWLYNQDPNLEHYNFPHNIFLNFWIDLGLLGALSMMAILAAAAVRGFIYRTNPKAFGLLLMSIVIVAHGLIDIPYLKNDLALMFWLVMAISLQTKGLKKNA